MKKVLIVGASGHGGVVLDSILKIGKYSVLGFLDSFKKKGSKHNGLEIMGGEKDLPRLLEKYDIYGVVIAIGNNWTRKKMVNKLMKFAPQIKFVTVIHPNAILGRKVKIGKGTVIMPGAIVSSNSRIGNFCILNTNSSLGHESTMEDYSSISSGVCTGGNLKLEKFSAISLGANVMDNITIGKNSLVGAGSLVMNNVMRNTVVYGSPARFIRLRNPEDPYLNGDKPSSSSSNLVSKK
ncbi:acetyltransferase [Arenibacter certesii]|uniref:Pilus assembly protein n=1 Tax=Arenibacter certesii TaxID=228955 RepID=A0A918MIK4_9FLAO|nr:acetyltransferase [Arenibacter certesii]GGW24580.1 pilus assembly protein [Arenibacter certesii]